MWLVISTVVLKSKDFSRTQVRLGSITA